MMNLNRSNGSSNSIPLQPHHPPPPPPPPSGHHGSTPLNVNHLMNPGSNTCVHTRSSNHLDQNVAAVAAAESVGNLIEDTSHTPYFMNRDGCMETTASASAEAAMAAGAALPVGGSAAAGSASAAMPPPPGLGMPSASTNVINPQGIKNLVHDVQLKRQKEIRDMMKKKREKAVLVDRISRWLFPTSFILLNIVYWALFGDHDLW